VTHKGRGKQVRSGDIRPRSSIRKVGVAGFVRASCGDRRPAPAVCRLLGLGQVAYGLGQLVASDLLAVHEQLAEDDLVHGPLETGAALLVKRSRVAEEIQGCQEELAAGGEARGGVGQLPGDLAALGLEEQGERDACAAAPRQAACSRRRAGDGG
jgi:hypothetical protein